MSHEITILPKAEEILKKLEKQDRLRIWERLKKASELPRHYLKDLSGTTAKKLRVGDYRLLCDLDDKNKKILVYDVDHRKRVYKK